MSWIIPFSMIFAGSERQAFVCVASLEEQGEDDEI